jgi:hypothetical protein
MTRTVRLAAAPGRLLLFLAALLLLSAIAIQLSFSAGPSRPMSTLQAIPGTFGQPPAASSGATNGPVAGSTVAAPAAATPILGTTRTVNVAPQPAQIPPAQAVTTQPPAQAAPAQPGCGSGGVPAGRGVVSRCPGG